jgi:hypothetical protein
LSRLGKSLDFKTDFTDKFRNNKKEIACCHGNKEHIFFGFNKLPGSWKTEKWLNIISMKFPIDRIPSCLILEFWDSGRIMAVGHWSKSQIRDSRIFSSSPWNFWSILKIWDFGRIGEWAIDADDHETNAKNVPGAETFRRSSLMFDSDSRNSSYALKSVFSKGRVLVKARILDS